VSDIIERKITLTIQLGEGDFGDAGLSNTATLDGLRCSVSIVKSNTPAADQADVCVWGVSQTTANAVSRLGKPLSYDRKNLITISAGDDVNGMSVVFKGIIWSCYQDFAEIPSVGLVMNCRGVLVPTLTPAPSFSYQGAINAVQVASTMASGLGLQLQNNRVDVMLFNPHYPGTPWDQFLALAREANFYAAIDTVHASLVIWPKGGTVTGTGATVTIEPPNLIGYPEFNDMGVIIHALFQPGLALGEIFNVVCSDPGFSAFPRQWQAFGITYNLSCQLPDGPWFVTILAILPPGGVPQ
jgi:hypothetical protein